MEEIFIDIHIRQASDSFTKEYFLGSWYTPDSIASKNILHGLLNSMNVGLRDLV